MLLLDVWRRGMPLDMRILSRLLIFFVHVMARLRGVVTSDSFVAVLLGVADLRCFPHLRPGSAASARARLSFTNQSQAPSLTQRQ